MPYGPVTAPFPARQIQQLQRAGGPPSGQRPVAREPDRTVVLEDLGERGRVLGRRLGDAGGGARSERTRLRIPPVAAQRSVPAQFVPRHRVPSLHRVNPPQGPAVPNDGLREQYERNGRAARVLRRGLVHS